MSTLLRQFATASVILLASVATAAENPPKVQNAPTELCKHQELGSFAPTGDGKSIVLVCWDLPPNWKPGDLPPGKGRDHLFLYDLESRGAEEVMDADDILVFPSPVGEKFVVEMHNNGANPARVLLMSGKKNVAEFHTMMLPYGGAWNADGSRFFFAADMTQDVEGFDTLGIIDLATQKFEKVKMLSVSENIAYCARQARVLTENWRDQGKHPADEYDEKGKYVGTSTLVGPPSAECHYSATWPSLHGPDNWEIYQAAPQKSVLQANWEEVGVFGGWSPKRDDLLALENYTKSSVDIYSIRDRKVIASFQNLPKYHWSADGSSLIIFRNGEFLYNRIPD